MPTVRFSSPRLALVLALSLSSCAAHRVSNSVSRAAMPQEMRSAAARAADLAGNVGWFGGLSIGATSFHGYELEAESTDLDDNDIGWMAYAGYQVHPYFAVAAGYVDLGSLVASGPAFGGFDDEISDSGIALMGVGVLPVRDDMAAYAIAGSFFWQQDVVYNDASGPFDGDSSGTSPMYGVGFNWYADSLETVGLNLAVLHFPAVGDLAVTDHENDVTMVMLGVLLHMP